MTFIQEMNITNIPCARYVIVTYENVAAEQGSYLPLGYTPGVLCQTVFSLLLRWYLYHINGLILLQEVNDTLTKWFFDSCSTGVWIASSETIIFPGEIIMVKIVIQKYKHGRLLSNCFFEEKFFYFYYRNFKYIQG